MSTGPFGSNEQVAERAELATERAAAALNG